MLRFLPNRQRFSGLIVQASLILLPAAPVLGQLSTQTVQVTYGPQTLVLPQHSSPNQLVDLTTVAVNFPKFNPALGTLNQVDIELSSRASLIYSGALSSPPSFAAGVVVDFLAAYRVTAPGVTVDTAQLQFQSSTTIFAPQTSVAFNFPLQSTGSSVQSVPGAFLASYQGTGSVAASLRMTWTQTTFSSQGLVNGSFAPTTDSLVRVTYHYTPPPMSFCHGDGSTGPCPCNNNGASGRGCANSVDPSGGWLQLSGTPNPDSLVLSGSGMPATVVCIYLQGDTELPAGVTFGDGLRCVDGTLVRLATKVNAGGSSQFPEGGDASVSVRGGITPGSGARRCYQTYYRNAAAAYCPPDTFNVTNGWIVVW